jgi:ABC-type polysaccharide/polyol phosphate transport system ATPase subunit
LTGREDNYVNGSVLGLTKWEIEAKVEDIIDFAGKRDFADEPTAGSIFNSLHARHSPILLT